MKKLLGLVVLILTVSAMAFGQAISSNGGAIEGTITDPTGAIVPGASVTVTGTDTGSIKVITADSAGFYSVGPLNPGPYTVTVTMAGFQKLSVKTVVRTGTVTSGNYKLTLGASTETIEVNAGQLQVNTEQAGVQDVLTREQVEALPINGRNFLDLAQVQPGVILQSGETFDPTKAGFSAISVDGVSGRTTRILLDGQDITDETVGTTIINVPTGAVDEFQLNRSTQDVSGEVTSTGQVLVATRSGTNAFHGQLFYNFQDNNVGFADTTDGVDAPFQRNQFGGNIGGPILKDKLFFFADVERIKQDQDAAATGSTFRLQENIANDPFLQTPILQQFPSIGSPFRDTFSLARVDYNGPFGGHYFARIFYEDNAVAGNFNEQYSIYSNRDNVPGINGGVDFTTGHFTHSFRIGYEKFHNLISDATSGNTSIYNPNNGLQLADSPDAFFAGPNFLAPQTTYQSDKQFRYDGTWTKGRHSFKYGASVNRLLGGGGAAFFGLAPQVTFDNTTLLAGGVDALGNPQPGCGGVLGAAPCSGDPLNGYSSNAGVTFGNNNSVFTEKPQFGLPGGGVEDWRSAYYFADSWKVSPGFTVVAGLRYSIDTDRANQDLAPPTCASATLPVPCTGNQPLLAQFSPILSGRVHQPYGNVAPQAGFVFSPGSHKLSIRAGIGMFFESDIFNNTSNARPPVLNATGPFFGEAGLCGGSGYTIALPGGGSLSSINGLSLQTVCGLPIGQGAPYLVAVRNAYVAATQANNTAANGSYIGNYLSTVIGEPYGTPYRTPYSIQYNGGFQYEVARGTIISVDYLHNATLKIPLIIDVNHLGSANNLNVTAAKAAIAATTASFGCAGGSASAAITCAIGKGALMTDFAGNGVDSSATYLSGLPASFFSLTPNTGAAFAGINPGVGQGEFILPTGQSGYDALQVVVKQVRSHPIRGIDNANYQISYSLSKIVSDAGNLSAAGSADQFFNSFPFDQYNPKSYMGRSSNDHSNELSFGGSFLIKYGPQLGVIGHFFSAGATTMTLPTTGQPGEIFRTDVTGDGTTGDLVPGTLPGDYMHRYKSHTLNNLITKYNATQAGQLTPAGAALVTAGLFTNAQLLALGAVKPILNAAPVNGAMPNPAFRAFDADASYPIRLNRIREGMTLVPGVAMYNLFNLANFSRESGQLQQPDPVTGAAATGPYLNGTNTYAVQDGLRTQRGSGTFDQGAPRTTEFSLKLNF